MIDIVYPIKPSEFNEIHYSMRSADKHFVDLGTKWVLSEEPPVTSSPHKWVYSRDWGVIKDQKINHKIIQACENPEISDPFIYSCDDMYFLRPTSVHEFDFPCAMSEPEWPYPARARRSWERMLFRTLTKLRDEGFPAYNYSTHIPWVVHKDKFLQAMEILGTGEQICSAYHNVHFDNPTMVRDTMLRAALYSPNTYEEILQKTVGKAFLNHNNRALNNELQSFIKSRFE